MISAQLQRYSLDVLRMQSWMYNPIEEMSPYHPFTYLQPTLRQGIPSIPWYKRASWPRKQPYYSGVLWRTLNTNETIGCLFVSWLTAAEPTHALSIRRGHCSLWPSENKGLSSLHVSWTLGLIKFPHQENSKTLNGAFKACRAPGGRCQGW